MTALALQKRDNKKSIPRDQKIQVIRGLLALIVIFIHVLPIDGDIPKICLRPFLNIAVAGYIFLSGYLTKLEFDTKKFYKKRLLTVLIPYILFTVIFTVLNKYKHGIVGIGAGIVENLFTAQATYTLYYLVVYMQFVLLTPLLARIVKQKSRILNICIYAIQPLYLICLYVGVAKGDILSLSPFYGLFFPAWIVYYYLGLIVGNGMIKLRVSNRLLIIAVIAGIIMQILEGLIWYQNMAIRDMYYTQTRLTTLLENIPVLLLFVRYIRSGSCSGNKLLSRIGDASFGIYLLHPVFIMVYNKILPQAGLSFLIAFAISAIGSMATVTILNMVVSRKVLKYCGLALAR